MEYDQRTARKITHTLFFSQCLSSAGFIAAFTVNALVAVDITGKPAMAGVPGAIYVSGQAGGALLWGYAMERVGRRLGIAAGQAFGVVGSALAVAGVFHRSLLLLLAGLLLVGLARSAVDLGRFAAAEIYPPKERGRAVSRVVLGSTAGAIVGPLLVGPMAGLSLGTRSLGLAGAYLAGGVALLAAAVLIFARLRPDPRDLAREWFAGASPPGKAARQSLRDLLRRPGVRVAMVTLAFTQIAMMVPMSITSVHMKHHTHALGAVSFVISAHALGMYAFSLWSGKLTDRKGRAPAIIAGAAIMALGCAWAGPSTGKWPLMGALFVLGLGWNLAYVAGSAMLSDQLAPGERSKMQGLNDLVMNVASGASQIASGLLAARSGYAAVCAAAAGAALVPLGAALWWRHRRREGALLPTDRSPT
jgi:MFS family permease